MKRNWIDINVTILGLSISGIAAAKYLSAQGANCTISEKRAQTEADLEQIKELEALDIKVEMGEHKEQTLLDSYLVIASPGIPPRAPIFKFLKENKIQVISEIELAYLETVVPFIAITGTNGKTTTTKLLSEILQTHGLKAPACGNIGLPPTSLLKEDLNYFVAELSSFQLETSKSFVPQIGCFLNYAPDHVDWHDTEEAYFNAKATIFSKKTPIWAVFNACDEKLMNLSKSCESIKWFFGKELGSNCVFISENNIICKQNNSNEHIISLNEISLIGEHNYQNIMAAIAIAKIVGVDNSTIKRAIIDFKSPEHRLEYVETINNIKFYNDSKATNCDSAICALKAFNEPVVFIAGGKDKGTNLTDLANIVKTNTSNVILLGEAAERFNNEFQKAGVQNIHTVETLEQAIDLALNINAGSVLFSPACSSFDMYKNFEERGRAYKQYILQKK